MSMMDVPPNVAPQPTALAPAQWISKNPQLASTPLGAYTDSQYEAAAAQLRAQIARQYADIVQQLGYKDDSGNFIPGTVEAQAKKTRAETQYGMDLATEQDDQQHQREGTLFSGLRGVTRARAQHPFVSALADLDTQVPQTLANLYENAAGLTDEYTRQNNILLADAAARAAAGFGTQPGQVVSAPSGAPALGASTFEGRLPAPGGPVDQGLAGLSAAPTTVDQQIASAPAAQVPGLVSSRALAALPSYMMPIYAAQQAKTSTPKKPAAPKIWGGQASMGRY